MINRGNNGRARNCVGVCGVAS